MKSTEINFPKEDASQEKKTLTPTEGIGRLRSLRPQKSMMRVKSLKPKRLIKTRRVSIHSPKN